MGHDPPTVFRGGNAGEDEENETHIAMDYDYSAGAGGGNLPWDTPLQNLRQDLTGPVAFTLSLIAFFVAGVALIFGGEMSHFVRGMVISVMVCAMLVGISSPYRRAGLLYRNYTFDYGLPSAGNEGAHISGTVSRHAIRSPAVITGRTASSGAVAPR